MKVKRDLLYNDRFGAFLRVTWVWSLLHPAGGALNRCVQICAHRLNISAAERMAIVFAAFASPLVVLKASDLQRSLEIGERSEIMGLA